MGRAFNLALRLVLRDWRSGELRILVAALTIAVAAVTAISLLGDRLTRTMSLQAAQFLGADLSVRGYDEPSSEWGEYAAGLGLKSSRVAEFSSVLVNGENILLVAVKAVAEGYPLRGEVKTTLTDLNDAVATPGIPESGETWVESRILSSLGLNIGSELVVGEKPLRITKILTEMPDRRGDIYGLSPTILINDGDVAATRVVQPGSRVNYLSLYAGEEQAVRVFKSWLKPQLHAGQKISDVHEDRPELGNAIVRAERYLGLASIAVVLIAGVAIAMSARRYSERHYDLTALLKCLGASRSLVLRLYLGQFLVIGMIGSFLGCALGYFLQEAMVVALGSLLPAKVITPSLFSLLLGMATGMLILFGFCLPPVLRLGRMAPLRVLRRDMEPFPSSALLVYGLSAGVLSSILWRFTHDFEMTLIFLGGGGLVLALFAAVGFSLLGLARHLVPRVPLAARFGLRNLVRHPRLGISQILAFTITLTAMLVSLMVRNELIQEWQRQLPSEAPNHFALNLFDSDLESFRELLVREQIPVNEIYPVVRGRLLAVDGKDVFEIMKTNPRVEGAVNRELSLTWSNAVPPGNRIVQGQWWQPEKPLEVSVEQGLAGNLGVKPGSTLLFDIGGQRLTVNVGSTRMVRWDSMQPNFFMIFPPGILNAYPHSWLTSFYLEPAHKAALARLAKVFPNVTILEVDRLLEQFQTIIKQLTRTVEFVLYLALLAGFTVLFSSVRATLDERIHENVLLRTMGASRKLLGVSQWVEFFALGFLSGILAAAIAELISWGMFARIFDIEYQLHWKNWLATPVVGGLLVGIVGYLNIRRAVNQSPVRVLREL